MSVAGLQRALAKMRSAGVHERAIEVFVHYYGQAETGQTGLVGEDSIAPLTNPCRLADVDVDQDTAQKALELTAVIRLNGGLGTSMGLDRAKTLLSVRDGRSFLDLIVGQIRSTRKMFDVRLPLIFMNSFRTREDTLAHLRGYPDLPVAGLPLDFLQNTEPKLLVDDLTPVEWPADPSLEWCPPGHGDIYTAIQTSGVLEALLGRGFRYALVANGDNLGASPDPALAGWFASSGAPFAAEVCRRTIHDRKGGHLAIRRSDGQLILREAAQTADQDLVHFSDINRHAFFNTNNLWLDLEQLHLTLARHGAVLGLPLIRNVKTVDPSDPTTPKVVQLETAMGAAIEVLPGAQAIVVGRDRFLPVKTTNDLLLIRSDLYRLTDNERLQALRSNLPGIDLDERFYRLIEHFDQRFRVVPSLRAAESLVIRGDWTFQGPTVVVGAAVLADTGSPQVLTSGLITADGPVGR